MPTILERFYMFIIKKDGNIVKHVVFVGSEDDLYKQKEVKILTFDDYKKAQEFANVINNSEIEKISEKQLKKISGV